MPCLNISTNVSLDGIDTSSILAEATKNVAKIIGKPESVIHPLSLWLFFVAFPFFLLCLGFDESVVFCGAFFCWYAALLGLPYAAGQECLVSARLSLSFMTFLLPFSLFLLSPRFGSILGGV